MCGSDEPHPYPLRSFTYRTEQVKANEVQMVIVYSGLMKKHLHKDKVVYRRKRHAEY